MGFESIAHEQDFAIDSQAKRATGITVLIESD